MMSYRVLQILAFLVGFLTGTGLLAQPSVTQAILDLRTWDRAVAPVLDLSGEWAWLSDSATTTVQVPGDLHGQGILNLPGTYQLDILLPTQDREALVLEIPEVLTAYEVRANGLLLGSRGSIGQDGRPLQPQYGRAVYILPSDTSTITIQIACHNQHHRLSGLMRPPRLGEFDAISASHSLPLLLGYLLIGMMLMSGGYQVLLYLNRRQEPAHLYHSIFCFTISLHFLCLHDRWLYAVAGPPAWAWIYKLELGTIPLALLIATVFTWHFFGLQEKGWRFWFVCGLQFLLMAAILLLPTRMLSNLDILLPIAATTLMLYIASMLVNALRNRTDGSLPFAISAFIEIIFIFVDGLPFGRYVDRLLLSHYSAFVFGLAIAWSISRRVANSHTRIASLSTALEAANKELAQQNKSLEVQIAARTAELIESREAAHKLQLEQQRRDLESVQANNLMKLQLTRNLIEDLQKLIDAENDTQSGLKRLIASLRGQVATEEKLQVLQTDFEVVNAEFYSRLAQHYPSLSKTEREICAYLKLNLSSKDIATLRQTSLNTINVARHRIRRKLGLERDEELEAFVRQL